MRFHQNPQNFFVPFRKDQVIPAVFISFDLAEAIDFERSYGSKSASLGVSQ